jgi:hypothetical protein
MAELKIEKRRKFPVLWTILGIIAVVVVVWFLVDSNDEINDNEDMAEAYESDRGTDGFNRSDDYRNDDQSYMDRDTTKWNDEAETWGDDSEADINARVPVTVQNFVRFASNTDTSSLTQERILEGISKLSAALAAVEVGESQDINRQRNLDRLNKEMDQFGDNRLSNQHGKIMKNAFVDAANIIQSEQQQRHPDLATEADQVMAAAIKIDEQRPVAEQKTEVKMFFDKSAETLQKMETGTGRDSYKKAPPQPIR